MSKLFFLGNLTGNQSLIWLTFSWSEDSDGSSRRRLCWELSSSKAACVVAVSDMCPFLSRRPGSGEPALSSSVGSFMRCWKPSQIFSFLLVQFGWLCLGSERQTTWVTQLKLKRRVQKLAGRRACLQATKQLWQLLLYVPKIPQDQLHRFLHCWIMKSHLETTNSFIS